MMFNQNKSSVPVSTSLIALALKVYTVISVCVLISVYLTDWSV